jgi:uncharacterized protein
MTDMIEVVIDSVRVSLMSPQRLIILRQVEGERYLPIWVGNYEAEAITVALQEIEMLRPLTHDLLKSVFGAFEAELRRVEITALRDDIFFGSIVAEADGKVYNIDARPSDAIALAVRAHIPILVEASVMAQAGITPEKDSNGKDLPPAETPPAEEGEDRLSIFEDFLNQLDDDPSSDEEKPET